MCALKRSEGASSKHTNVCLQIIQQAPIRAY